MRPIDSALPPGVLRAPAEPGLAIAILAALTLSTGTVAAEATKPKDITKQLHGYYGTATGYKKVTADVLKWHGTKHNGCVAFASTALRHVGVEIPVDGKINGLGVSRITGSFSRYLADVLGWTRVEKMDELRAGDIVFSTDAPCCPGYPNHVVMFEGWVNRTKGLARVVDNQGFQISRPFIRTAGSDVDAFQYALRPPAPKAAEPAPQAASR